MLDAQAKFDRLSRADYDRMVERGELEDQRVELIRGRIVEMSPQGGPHVWVINRLTMLLAPVLKDRAIVQIQGPLAVSDDSEPEPDVAVLELRDYKRELATTALLVIEVADSSLAKDRRDKAPLYAECDIPEYWIVNVPGENVEVYLHPENGTYQTVKIYTGDEVLRSSRLPMLEIAVADIF